MKFMDQIDIRHTLIIPDTVVGFKCTVEAIRLFTIGNIKCLFGNKGRHLHLRNIILFFILKNALNHSTPSSTSIIRKVPPCNKLALATAHENPL